MTGVYSQLITVQDRPARVWRGGTGKPLVLLHGGLGDASTHWRWCWSSLADSYAVFAPDLPGFGGMTAPLPDPSYQAYVEWLIALFDALQLKDVALAGNSIGGVFARLTAPQQRNRVTHLILVNGGNVSMSGAMQALLKVPGVSGLVMNAAARSSASPKTLEKAVYNKALLTPEFVAETHKRVDDFNETMRVVAQTALPPHRAPNCPTLIVWGTQDHLADPKASQNLIKEIPGAKLRQIENSGHMPQMEQTEAFIAAIRTFVRE